MRDEDVAKLLERLVRLEIAIQSIITHVTPRKERARLAEYLK